MLDTVTAPPLSTATEVRRRPRFEGCNIGAWLGFKHLMYLTEEAVIEHFRALGFGPRRLFQELELALDVVDSGIRIAHVVHVDDVVRMKVTPEISRTGAPMFHVRAFLDGETGGTAKDLKLFSGKVRVALVPQPGNPRRDWPEAIAPYVVAPGVPAVPGPPAAATDGRGLADPADDLAEGLAPAGANTFVWKWRIPYFYCHDSTRLQHSGYVRMLEEVVDLFLASRGLSIRTMLEKHHWIPFVQNARIELLNDALMEETIYTVFTVTDVYKNLLYGARVECYVARDGALVPTARGDITHGYAQIRSRSDWGLVPFDAETASALQGIDR